MPDFIMFDVALESVCSVLVQLFFRQGCQHVWAKLCMCWCVPHIFATAPFVISSNFVLFLIGSMTMMLLMHLVHILEWCRVGVCNINMSWAWSGESMKLEY